MKKQKTEDPAPPEPVKKERKKKWTKEQIEEALVKNHGYVHLAAKNLGCNHKTIYRMMEKSPPLAKLVNDLRELEIDQAELKLHEAIMEGKPWAIKLKLMTQGKNRGYSERHELTGRDGEELRAPVSVVGVDYRAAIASLAPGPMADSATPGEN